MEKEIEKLEKYIINYVYNILKNDKVHGFEHTMRVYNLALRIARKYDNVNITVLKLACLLHDVGRPLENKLKKHHAIISAEMAEKILKNFNVNDKIIKEVKHAILAHSFSLGIKPQSIEAKILSDADKLDAIGAIGIARCFMLSGALNRSLDQSIQHFHDKLLKLKDLMWTEEAKRIAEHRHKFMVNFLKELNDELKYFK